MCGDQEQDFLSVTTERVHHPSRPAVRDWLQRRDWGRGGHRPSDDRTSLLLQIAKKSKKNGAVEWTLELGVVYAFSRMAFSGALTLTDLNDFINPLPSLYQTCRRSKICRTCQATRICGSQYFLRRVGR